jgi:hypothetical protein
MRALLVLVAAGATAHADTAIIARGTAILKRSGKQDVTLATLPAGSAAKALIVDPTGAIAVVDLGGGKWVSARLDAATPAAAIALPCIDVPRFADDGALAVICRGAGGVTSSVDPASGKAVTLTVPAVARVAGGKLVWVDGGAVWAAPATALAQRTRLAPEAPLRNFSPSPDGTRAVGVYADFVRERRAKQPAELLMLFALDGEGARRKGMRGGVPLAGSRDGQYVLIQDGAAACLMRATGGQFKCWKGFRPVAISASGTHALVMQRRSLYRAELEGAFTAEPDVVARDVDAAGYAP